MLNLASNSIHVREKMAAPFNSDTYRRPNSAIDGTIPKILRPWEGWSPPTLPDLYPWWVDPRMIPTPTSPAPGPRMPSLAPPPQGQTSVTDPPQGAPGNWLLSDYEQNGDNQRHPINAVPAGIGTAPAERPGGLLGMLYEVMRQREPEPDGNFDPNPPDALPQALPERRLGRRTYRQ